VMSIEWSCAKIQLKYDMRNDLFVYMRCVKIQILLIIGEGIMSNVIMGYWNCESCGAVDIEGLMDVCPSCAARKPAHIRYHMKGRNVVSKEQLMQAGIGEDECDGQHKEWVCAYCGYLNNFSSVDCESCGAPKEEAEQEYGDEPEKSVPQPEPVKEMPTAPKIQKKKRHIGKIILASFLLLFVILLFPYKQVWTVTGFKWEREITLEQMKTVQESGWSVPDGARVYKEAQEIQSYAQQISHYEEVTVTKSREVIDHYETEYEYVDNGNGTFTENAYEVPVYRTEYYEEVEQQPVYISVPIYATRYYYDMDQWYDAKQYLTSGTDQNPYWNESYTLKEGQRDEKRREEYYVIYDKGESLELTFEEWNTYNPGDTYKITTCLLGVVYSEKNVNAID